MSKLWLEKKIFYLGEEGDQGVPFQKKVFPMYSNQLMDSRNVNFSIKKSQIDTHMLGVAQKLTKLDIALETSVAWDSGSGSQKMPCPAVPNLLLFTFLWDFQSSLDKSRENSSKMPKRQNSGNTSMKVAETPAGNQQRETVHGPPFYVAGAGSTDELSILIKIVMVIEIW